MAREDCHPTGIVYPTCVIGRIHKENNGLLIKMVHPEYRFEPMFDKTQSVLDAKGGPQDLLSDFSLITIHPDSQSNNPTLNQRHSFFIAPPRVLIRTPVQQNAKRFGRRSQSAGPAISLPPQTPNPKTPPLKLALTELIKRQFPILTSHSNIGPVIAHLNFADL